MASGDEKYTSPRTLFGSFDHQFDQLSTEWQMRHPCLHGMFVKLLFVSSKPLENNKVPPVCVTYQYNLKKNTQSKATWYSPPPTSAEVPLLPIPVPRTHAPSRCPRCLASPRFASQVGGPSQAVLHRRGVSDRSRRGASPYGGRTPPFEARDASKSWTAYCGVAAEKWRSGRRRWWVGGRRVGRHCGFDRKGDPLGLNLPTLGGFTRVRKFILEVLWSNQGNGSRKWM